MKTKKELEAKLAELLEKQEKAISNNSDRSHLIAISNAILEVESQIRKAKD